MKFKLVESIGTTEDILNKLSSQLKDWQYGGKQDGKIFTDDEYQNIDFSRWTTRPIKELENDKFGNCWDFVNYEHYFLKKNDVKHKCYMLYIDRDGNPDHAVTHSFIIADGIWYEDAAYPLRGLHKNFTPEMVAKELNNFIYKENSKYYIWEYNPDNLDNYISADGYMEKVTESEPIIEGQFNEKFSESVDKSELNKNFKNKEKINLSALELKTRQRNDEGKSLVLSWYKDGNFVATVLVDTIPASDGYKWFGSFRVSKKYRGHGLSNQIMKLLIDQYGAGALSVHKDNEIAINLYKKFGFKISKSRLDGEYYFMYLKDNKIN